MDRLIMTRHAMTQANMDKKLSHYDTKVCEQGRQESLQWVKRNA